ncbi:MAG: hypothetical protein IKL81_00480 [Clostridia bacterium]|nr:hypothetical protein [Clostridia bacterium]
MKKDFLGNTDKTEQAVGEYTVKTSSLTDILVKCSALLIAFFIWLYAGAQEDVTKTEKFSDIPVQILTSDKYLPLNDFDYTVDVTVSGRSRELDKLSTDSFRATIDATNISRAGEYTFDINVTYPGSAELVDQSLRTIVVDFDRTVTATVDVKIQLTNYNISEPYEIGTPISDITQVAVTGPGEIVKQVDSALITIYAGNLTATTTYGGRLVAADASGKQIVSNALSFSKNDVTVTVPVLMSKVVPLKVSYKYGYLNSSNAELSVEPSSVILKGEASLLKTMNEIVLDSIDEKMLLTPSVTREIRLPDGVTNVSEINMATVNVKHVGTSTFRYSISDIIYVNPNSIEYSPLTESISVTLRGPSETVGALNPESIIVTADLSSLKVGQGVVDLPVSISVRGDGTAGCYEIGSYVIKVSV